MSQRTARMAVGLTVFASATILLGAIITLGIALETLGIVGAAAGSAGLVGFAVATERYARRQAATEVQMTVLRQAAHTDTLTALGNRRAYQEELKRETSRAARAEQPLSLALLDIDDFKAFNDVRGHAGGDLVLVAFARAVLFLLRAEDRAFRIGGDEFAVLMPNTPADGALSAIQRLRSVLQEGLAEVKLSIGIAAATSGKIAPDLLVERADIALYEAKHGGKNKTVCFEDEPGLVEETLAKWQELRNLLVSAGPSVAFQPIYELSTMEIFAFEALMRLPPNSLISGPLESFEIADRMGMVFELDSVCIARAISMATSRLPHGTRLFINVDPKSLVHPSFSPGAILDQVQDHGLSPHSIVFEITERSTVPVERLALAAEQLTSLGFQLAIDDVGSGNSGLEMLRRIRFDYIKIDRSVVLDAVKGGPGKAVMMAIVAFAAQSRTCVIAEGIESAAMLDAVELEPHELPDFSIWAVQGFLFDELGRSGRDGNVAA